MLPRSSVGPTAPRPKPYAKLRYDIPASIVVFLVAMPLCLGIAHASGAPLVAGIISGVIGGVVVSWLSGSQLAVSGPAAGLTVLVLAGIERLGGYDAFLCAVLVAGGVQIVLGIARAGIVAYYFPSNVIHGLLAAIGALVILKQLPHALGIDTDFMGDEALAQVDGRNTFSEIGHALASLQPGAIAIAGVGLAIVVVLDRKPVWRRFAVVPAPLLAVASGVLIHEVLRAWVPSLVLAEDDMVHLPQSAGELFATLPRPALDRLGDPDVWTTGLVIAAVASLETLLCVEAIDKLDPYRRVTPTNRELVAQGIGNILCALAGGLPITAVVVRGSANVQAGGRTRSSAFVHGVLLAAAVLAIPTILNRIPLASLAAVLLHVGYKLTRATLWKTMWRQGRSQFAPFAITFVAILATDLLRGVAIGLAVSVFFLLKANFEMPYAVHTTETAEGGETIVRIELSEHVSFLNKAAIRRALHELPAGSVAIVDGSRSRFIDRDVIEILWDFATEAPHRGIQLELRSIPVIGGSVAH